MATIVRHGEKFEHMDRSDPLNNLNIGVLYGGPSSERAVSIQSGEAVAKALAAKGRTVTRVLLDGTFDEKIARSLNIDVAFLALHGQFGEDGHTQLLLEKAGIPYTGSGPDASSNAFDKLLAKQIYERAGICTPAWMCYDREQIEAMGGPEALDLAPPVVVKPVSGGSSLGVTIVHSFEQAAGAITEALKFDDTIIVERFIAGRELSVPILGEEPLPVVELKVAGLFYDYHAKYEDERTQILCPAPLTREETTRVQAAALAAHRALECRDLSRTDFLLDAQGMPWALETNTIPGLTSHSQLPRAAETVGTSFVELCEYLIMVALGRGAKREAA